ncbi:MAG: tetratricopeptide repeat protein [Prolixibacteraceae bacterium]|nr:tetratricopeptide repeat protein [Prolixibacteraceae bacterium]
MLSCNGDFRKSEKVLKKAENIVELHPDSALLLLETIGNPYLLTKEQHARYVLRLVQAKDKCDKDISSDTLIFQARGYFKIKNNLNELAFAEFYCGRVFQTKGNRNEAMKAYLKAGSVAKELNNKGLVGLSEFYCGLLNYDQHLFDEAIIHLKEAVLNFSQTEGKNKNQVVPYNYIGNSFLLKQLPDSAFFYYNKGLMVARQYNDSANELRIVQNMGVAYLKLGNTRQAKESLRMALSLSSGESRKAKAYLNLADVFYKEGSKDSALFYLNHSLRLAENNASLLANVYRLFSKIEATAGNYEQAMSYNELYTKHLAKVLEEKEDIGIMDIQKKYDFELLENANSRLLIERQWIFICFLLFGITTFWVLYYNRAKNREAMLIAEQHIFQLKEIVNKRTGSNVKNNELRKTLIKQLDIVKKISLIESYLKGEEKVKGKEVLKKVNEIIYGQDDFNWSVFNEMANALHDNYLERLHNLFPDLSETELLICCLSKIGLNNMEISLLIKTTQNAVQKRKSVIRQKTAMKEQESFIKQLDQIVNKNKPS